MEHFKWNWYIFNEIGTFSVNWDIASATPLPFEYTTIRSYYLFILLCFSWTFGDCDHLFFTEFAFDELTFDIIRLHLKTYKNHLENLMKRCTNKLLKFCSPIINFLFIWAALKIFLLKVAQVLCKYIGVYANVNLCFDREREIDK